VGQRRASTPSVTPEQLGHLRGGHPRVPVGQDDVFTAATERLGLAPAQKGPSEKRLLPRPPNVAVASQPLKKVLDGAYRIG